MARGSRVAKHAKNAGLMAGTFEPRYSRAPGDDSLVAAVTTHHPTLGSISVMLNQHRAHTYGFCNWFLNNPSKASDGTVAPPFPSAPRSSVTFQGNGINVIYLDWDHDLLMVVRWIDTSRNFDQFIGRVIASIKP